MKIKNLHEKGAVALGSILVLAAILLAVGLAMSFSGFMQSDIALNQDKSAVAFYAAEAGAKDAMQKVARNKNYSFASPGYSLAVGNGSATVIANKDQPVAGQTEILSTGVVAGNTKKIRVIISTDAAIPPDGSGKVAIVSWEEMAN